MLHGSFIPTSVASDTSEGFHDVELGFKMDVVAIELLEEILLYRQLP
jgi:hypothetical protein